MPGAGGSCGAPEMDKTEAQRSMEARMEEMLERERTARMHSRWLHASSFENRVLQERAELGGGEVGHDVGGRWHDGHD